jgi:glycosyltransferase involved in cell wall biosynthesis
MMTPESVSVILSVENAQNWLSTDIQTLIECLADLTGRFEIIVVDNASRDYTVEILDDLHCRFPQVRYRRLAKPLSLDKAIDFGVSMASGEFIFTTAPGARIETNDLRRLWSLRVDPRLLMARSQTTARRVDAGLISRLTQWAQRITEAQEPVTPIESFGGLQMMRRQAMDQLQPLAARATTDEMKAALPSIEISHISHQQLTSPKLVEARRRTQVR